MPEPELSLLFVRPLNQLVRSMLAVSGDQIDRVELDQWIQRQGLEKEWNRVV